MTPLELPGAPKMEVKITLGAPQDAEKWSKNCSGGPPARTSEFVFAPGGLQERSGVDFYSVLAPQTPPTGPTRLPPALPQFSIKWLRNSPGWLLGISIFFCFGSWGLQALPGANLC